MTDVAGRHPERPHGHRSKYVDGHSRDSKIVVGSKIALDRPRHQSRDESATDHLIGPRTSSRSRRQQEVAFHGEARFHGAGSYGDDRCRLTPCICRPRERRDRTGSATDVLRRVEPLIRCPRSRRRGGGCRSGLLRHASSPQPRTALRTAWRGRCVTTDDRARDPVTTGTRHHQWRSKDEIAIAAAEAELTR